jgi:hypothetical protein
MEQPHRGDPHDGVVAAVDVLRVFQHARHFRTELTHFGLPGDVGNGVLVYAARHDRPRRPEELLDKQRGLDPSRLHLLHGLATEGSYALCGGRTTVFLCSRYVRARPSTPAGPRQQPAGASTVAGIEPHHSSFTVGVDVGELLRPNVNERIVFNFRSDWPLPHLTQPTVVGAHCRPQTLVTAIVDPVVPAELFDCAGQTGVDRVRIAREEVMLDLMIKSTYVPGQPAR